MTVRPLHASAWWYCRVPTGHFERHADRSLLWQKAKIDTRFGDGRGSVRLVRRSS